MKTFISCLGLCLVCAGAFAWPYPPASGIKVTTNGFLYIQGSNVESMLHWVDTNMLRTAAGYVTQASIDDQLSNTSTQTFGAVSVGQDPTNAFVRLGMFYGFVATGAVEAVTNQSDWAVLATCTNAMYNPQTYLSVSTGKFIPLVRGYYRVMASASGDATCAVRIVTQNTNNWIEVGTVNGTSYGVSGGGIIWLNGTSTNYCWLESQCRAGIASSTLHRTIFSAEYLGR